MAVNTISLVLNSLAFIKHKRKARKKVMDNTPYFPSVYQKPECFKCEKTDCMNRNKYQRDRRDFMCTSADKVIHIKYVIHKKTSLSVK